MKTVLSILTMPKDTNPYGTIFGGVILSYIDQAALIMARDAGLHRWVTVSFDKVDFIAPVHVGDNVKFNASIVKEGTKSVTIQVEVVADRGDSNESVLVTKANVVMVAVDQNGHSIPFKSPSTLKFSSDKM